MTRMIFLIPFLLFGTSFVYGDSCSQDRAGIQKTFEEYRIAWLANDQDRVMRTLTSDAILMPASSKSTIVGNKAIREYWWPKNSAFSIDEFTQTLLDVESCVELSYVRGNSHVAWSTMTNGVKSKNASDTNFLAVLKKDHDSWRIRRLVWYQTN